MVSRWFRTEMLVALLVLVLCPTGHLSAEEQADPPADLAKAAKDAKADTAKINEAVWGFSLEGLKEIEQTPKETNAMRDEVRKLIEEKLGERKFDELQWSARLSMEDLEFVLVKVRSITSTAIALDRSGIRRKWIAEPGEDVFARVFRAGDGTRLREGELYSRIIFESALSRLQHELDIEAKEKKLIQGRRINVPVDSDPATPKPEPDKPAARRWSDASGKLLATGDVKGVQVVVESADGKRTTVPLEKLSDADRQFVNDWLHRPKGPK